MAAGKTVLPIYIYINITWIAKNSSNFANEWSANVYKYNHPLTQFSWLDKYFLEWLNVHFSRIGLVAIIRFPKFHSHTWLDLTPHVHPSWSFIIISEHGRIIYILNPDDPRWISRISCVWIWRFRVHISHPPPIFVLRWIDERRATSATTIIDFCSSVQVTINNRINIHVDR